MTKMINNLRRSGDQSEMIELQLDFYTPEQKLKELRQRLLEYVTSQNRDFFPSCDLTISEIENMNRLLCKINLKHKGNWQDMGKKSQRRNEFMFALIRNLIELQLSYSLAPQKSMEKLQELEEQAKSSFSKPSSPSPS